MKYFFPSLVLLVIFILSLFTAPILSASQIGTGTVVSSGGLSTPINWNDSFIAPSASGTINGIYVLGRILPTLNMTISGSGVISLGNLSSTVALTGSVDIEIGTNALNGASVTARSLNAGMINSSSGAIVINSLVADGAADSYKFISAINSSDSTYPGFSHTATLNVEVNSSVTNHTLYSSTRPQPLT